MDHTGPLLDLSHAGPDIITAILGSLPLRDRFICALVCKAWAEAATAATHKIILKHMVQHLSGLQHWLEKHGDQLEVLQLHYCYTAAPMSLPCCGKLQGLLLHGCSTKSIIMASRAWGDIASATKLTSVSLKYVWTASQQADVVAALTALPNLEQLTWHDVHCSNQRLLTDSSLLQQMMQLTSLQLHPLTAAALQHLSSVTKLQHLSISSGGDWLATRCPVVDLPASTSQLTALRQLDVSRATPTALNQLQVLTGLTQLCVRRLTGLSPESPPLKLPGLQQLELQGDRSPIMPMSFLASCTQLQLLKLWDFELKGPGSLVASTILQHLELDYSSVAAADGVADTVLWQQAFPGPGRLPHLTALRLYHVKPKLQQADIEGVAACCCNLKALDLAIQVESSISAPDRRAWLKAVPGLTKLRLDLAYAKDYDALAQLTDLRQLCIQESYSLSTVEVRQLAVLNQLTSLGICRFYHSLLYTLPRHLMNDDLPGCPYAIINKVCQC